MLSGADEVKTADDIDGDESALGLNDLQYVVPGLCENDEEQEHMETALDMTSVRRRDWAPLWLGLDWTGPTGSFVPNCLGGRHHLAVSVKGQRQR